jgi:aminodeoxyfutalosine deaminase
MSTPKQSAANGQARPRVLASPYPEADHATDLLLHRAAWLVPVVSAPLQNGAVLVEGNHILAAGPYPEVKAASPLLIREVDHGHAAILPGLVNAHTHLELSGLHESIGLPQVDFAQWLTALLALRPLMTQGFLEQGLERGQQELFAGGCCLCGDITNGACLKSACQSQQRELPTCANEQLLGGSAPALLTPSTQHPTQNAPHFSPLTPCSHLTRQVFLEVLGFDPKGLAEALDGDAAERLEMLPASSVPPSLAAHACYSTAGALIREAKEWCRARGLRFSMHVAEHLDEVEFLEHGTGFCREVLEALGRWTPHWMPPRTSPVRYLAELQVLDSKTLLVHAVHLTDADWELVVRNHCPVCFCPRSNQNLKVGQPDIGKAVRSGLVVALGTDSLASNTDLNLFAEAAYVLDHYPDVPPGTVIHMVTLGGARALGQEQHFGSVSPGKRADLLTVSVPASLPPHQLFETIIQQGHKGAWQWVDHPANRYDWAKSVI